MLAEDFPVVLARKDHSQSFLEVAFLEPLVLDLLFCVSDVLPHLSVGCFYLRLASRSARLRSRLFDAS